MATLPEGAEPLTNPIGTAPGVRLETTGTLIIALPGVPEELKAIFEKHVVPILQKLSSNLRFFQSSVYTENIGESSLAPLIDATLRDNPYVYIKSHPKGGERKPHIEIHFSTTNANSTIAKNQIKKAMDQITKLLRKDRANIKIRISRTF
jgi:molybdopterin-biosynthesis enzyme MoeA-like protein